MKTKVTIQRLATGVPGLDEVLGGGLPEFSFNLIAGRPGCGKTTLAHQIMFALATVERPALKVIYLSGYSGETVGDDPAFLARAFHEPRIPAPTPNCALVCDAVDGRPTPATCRSAITPSA